MTIKYFLIPLGFMNEKLHRIHLDRVYKRPVDIVSLMWLEMSYKETRDIRFLNELLFFDESKIDLLDKIPNKLPLSIEEKIQKKSNQVIDDFAIIFTNPIQILIPWLALKLRYDFKVQLYWIKVDNRCPKNAVRDFHFFKIVTSPSVASVVLDKNYDLGFHKCNFILKDSLLDQFRIGVINDHWGELPVMRGKSTLDWQRYFGAKYIRINQHLIGKKIDSGLITSKADVKSRIYLYLGLFLRVIRSVDNVMRGHFYPNEDAESVYYYQMNAILKKRI